MLKSKVIIFFVTHIWTLQARVLQYTSLRRIVKDKTSSLLDQLKSDEEN